MADTVANPGSFRSLRVSLVCLVVLSSCVAVICLLIEYQNYRAGGVLPRDTRSIIEAGGNAKWRTAPPFAAYYVVLIETRGQEYVDEHWDFMWARDDEALHLTDHERAMIEPILAEIKADRRLQDSVGSVGCMQYPLCVVGMVWSGMLVSLYQELQRRGRTIAGICGTVCLVSLCFAFYRAYFSSLGW